MARYDQTFKVYISPSCRSTKFSHVGAKLVDMRDISIKESKVKQKLPILSSTVAADINTNWGFSKGECGSTTYSIKMQDD